MGPFLFLARVGMGVEPGLADLAAKFAEKHWWGVAIGITAIAPSTMLARNRPVW